jgi:hypothetical protein
MTPITCPSCGASNALPNPAVVSIVCPYCDNISYINKEGIRLSGKKSRLSEGFSRLFRGGSGSIHDKKFIVRGRVRYSFGRGFWDEWYIEWENGDMGWITEDNHQFSLQKEVVLNSGIIEKITTVGCTIKVRTTEYTITEIGKARCLGIEGALPKDITPDEVYRYIDGVSVDGQQTIGLEFDEGDDQPPRTYIGEWVSHKELIMEDNNYAW